MGKNLKKLFLLGLLLTIFAGQKYYAQVASLSEPPLISRSSNPASHVDHIDPVPHDVTVLNLHVHYVESGSGPTVVLIHGNAGGVEDFELGAIDLLSSRFRVIAIDRAGHGGSDMPGTEDASVEFQAKLLHETMSAIGVDKPILVGHSWGAAVALSYSLTYPDSIKGLVLLAPAAYPDGKSYKLLRAAARVPVFHELCVWFGQSIMGRNILKSELERAFYPQKMPDKYFKLVKASWLGRKQFTAYLEDESDLNDSLKRMNSHYRNIRLPVVIITGDKDTIVSPKDNAMRLNKAIPRSRLVILKDTGHEIPQTHPESILAALKLF